MLRGVIALVVVAGVTAPLAAGHAHPEGCAADHSLVMDMTGLDEIKRNGGTGTDTLVGGPGADVEHQ